MPRASTYRAVQICGATSVDATLTLIKLAAQDVYERVILSAGDGGFEDEISYVKSDLHKEIWICGSQSNLWAGLPVVRRSRELDGGPIDR